MIKQALLQSRLERRGQGRKSVGTATSSKTTGTMGPGCWVGVGERPGRGGGGREWREGNILELSLGKKRSISVEKKKKRQGLGKKES